MAACVAEIGDVAALLGSVRLISAVELVRNRIQRHPAAAPVGISVFKIGFVFNFLLRKNHFIGGHHHRGIPAVALIAAELFKEGMNSVEGSATARAENGKTVVEGSDNIRVGGFALNIGRIINGGRSDTEFKSVELLGIRD